MFTKEIHFVLVVDNVENAENVGGFDNRSLDCDVGRVVFVVHEKKSTC